MLTVTFRLYDGKTPKELLDDRDYLRLCVEKNMKEFRFWNDWRSVCDMKSRNAYRIDNYKDMEYYDKEIEKIDRELTSIERVCQENRIKLAKWSRIIETTDFQAELEKQNNHEAEKHAAELLVPKYSDLDRILEVSSMQVGVRSAALYHWNEAGSLEDFVDTVYVLSASSIAGFYWVCNDLKDVMCVHETNLSPSLPY
jgi:hypothetical protein